MKKALMITVGTGPTVENGIFTSLRNNNPDLVVFLVSKESRQTLERSPIEAKGKTLKELFNCEVVELETAEDIDVVFQRCQEIYCQLLSKNYSPLEIVVDITSGTKPMSAALAAFAAIYRLDIYYISGKRDGPTVKTGTERPIVMRPGRIMRRIQLEKLKDYFSRYQFSACLKLAEYEQEQVKLFSGEEEKGEANKISRLLEFLEGFVCWEHFDHKEALSHFHCVESAKVQQKYLEDLRDDKVRTANAHKDAKGNIPSKYVVIDLFQNARRRAKEQNFDDAVARLYRCIEMTIQYALAETNKIYSADVELEMLRNKISSETFERLSSKSDTGKVQLGLMDGLNVLAEVSPSHPISVGYDTLRQELKACLDFRNYSILAHGVKPVGRENYDKMEKLALKFVQAVAMPLSLSLEGTIGECFDVKNLDAFI